MLLGQDSMYMSPKMMGNVDTELNQSTSDGVALMFVVLLHQRVIAALGVLFFM